MIDNYTILPIMTRGILWEVIWINCCYNLCKKNLIQLRNQRLRLGTREPCIIKLCFYSEETQLNDIIIKSAVGWSDAKNIPYKIYPF